MPYRIRSPLTRRRIGRRGACLLVFGLVPFMVGLSLCVTPTTQDGRPRTAPTLELLAPPEFWSYAWMLLGLVVMASAMVPPHRQRAGFVLAYSLPLLWGAAFLSSWALGWLTTGWVSGLVYLGYAALVTTISGWEETPTFIVMQEPPRAD
jgi:MFS family permease